MVRYYIYDKNPKEPFPIKSGLEFDRWAEQINRRIMFTFYTNYLISTVFLGIDHGYGTNKPVLWETIIFKEGLSVGIYQDRYDSYDDAISGHHEIIKRIIMKEIE